MKAAKEKTLRAVFFLLAAVSVFATPKLAENSRLGFAAENAIAPRGVCGAKPLLATGLRRVGYDLRVRAHFQGQWWDEESGLHYNWNRYYEPATGRYLSPDPIGLEGGTRSYGYVHNPARWVDPWGLAGCGDASSTLPQMKGMSEGQVRSTLADEGFTQTRVSNSPGRNETWTHSDGSEVRIHPYGNEQQAPYRSANNAHVHKQDSIGNQLTDRGIPSTNPDETHIGISNPPDLPQVRGRPHGAGTQ